MELLFGGNHGSYPSIEGMEYSYKSWQENGKWHETLHVFGKAILAPGDGFRRVMEKPCLVTLSDKETHLWKYLELREKGSLGKAYASIFAFIVCAVLAMIASLFFAYYVEAAGWLSMSWYVRYPLFIIGALFLVLFGFAISDVWMEQRKLWKLKKFVQELPRVTGRDLSYYKGVLQKITESQDKERARGARKVLRVL